MLLFYEEFPQHEYNYLTFVRSTLKIDHFRGEMIDCFGRYWMFILFIINYE